MVKISRVVYHPVGGSPFTKNKHGDMPKADESYTPAPVMVHVNKPAHYRKVAFTYKTGGCNSKADVVERTCTQAPQGNASAWKGNRWCCPSLQNQSVSWYEKG